MYTLFLFPDETKNPPTIESNYFTLTEINLGWNNSKFDFQYNKPEKILNKIRELPLKRIVPLSEESVILAGYLNDALCLDGIGLDTAIYCSYRKNQREVLSDLAPLWCSFEQFKKTPFFPYVIKSPFSTLSKGVEIVNNLDFNIEKRINNLKSNLDYIKQFKDMNYEIIIEEYLEGPQYESNGIIFDNEIFFFNTLEQVWDSGRIKEYKAIENNKINSIAKEAVKRIGLNNCGFNIEIRQNKIIEIQARLGIDNGKYDFLLSPTKYIYDKLIEVLS